MTEDETLDLGVLLIKEHRAPQVLFWLEGDWTKTWGVDIRVSDDGTDRVISRLKHHGRGFLVPDYHPN